MTLEPGGHRRAFGFGTRGSPASRAARDRFDALSVEADRAGVAWRDLVGEAYRVPGDVTVGGLTVRVDWAWRAAELERRLEEQPDRP